jgi:hypothetical protein
VNWSLLFPSGPGGLGGFDRNQIIDGNKIIAKMIDSITINLNVSYLPGPSSFSYVNPLNTTPGIRILKLRRNYYPTIFEQVITKLNAIITVVLSSGLNHSRATFAWILIMNGLPIPPISCPKIIVEKLQIT